MKRYIAGRTNKTEIRPREERENRELGEFMEWNTVQMSIETEIDTRVKKKEKKECGIWWLDGNHINTAQMVTNKEQLFSERMYTNCTILKPKA